MEVFNFIHKRLKEIPEKANPAFGKESCFIVCRSADYTEQKRRYIVLRVKPVENPKENESITRVAIFWDSKLALDFTMAYVHLFKNMIK